MNVFVLVGIMIIVLGLGGGGMVWLYFKTRPKTPEWTAEIFRKSESTFKKGDLTLSKMTFVGIDTLQKIEHETGKVIYKLANLNRTTPSPTDDTIIPLKDGTEKVRVLLDGENTTLLKSGYDEKRGLEVFNPIPYDRMNLMSNNIQVKKDRLRKDKDILTKITPWIVTAIGVLGLIAMTYFIAGSSIDVSANNVLIQEKRLEHERYMAEYNRETMLQFKREIEKSVETLKDVQEQNKPQSIE